MRTARLKLKIRERGQPWVIFTRYVWPDGSVRQFPEPKPSRVSILKAALASAYSRPKHLEAKP